MWSSNGSRSRHISFLFRKLAIFEINKRPKRRDNIESLKFMAPISVFVNNEWRICGRNRTDKPNLFVCSIFFALKILFRFVLANVTFTSFLEGSDWKKIYIFWAMFICSISVWAFFHPFFSEANWLKFYIYFRYLNRIGRSNDSQVDGHCEH